MRQALALELLVLIVVKRLQALASTEATDMETCLPGRNWPPEGETAAAVIWARLLDTRYADRDRVAPKYEADPVAVEALSRCPVCVL